ncbi:copper homeostasis protein CutC [Actinoplanes subtropicus]|uniref:copper homeostasis protein CutC n=1 Tax=Actinoplanes subtropicus TaxID=543632 RepID=UPI0007C5085A|nr:copper homeostasis protein CutC [Actinoplanes subtropicus]
MGMVDFELAVQDPHGLQVAARLGVDRIELCAALALGGLTPSWGLIETALETPGIPPVHVLIRPRPGGFAYDPDEVRLITRDIRKVGLGVAGVVVGGVRAGRVDTNLIERVVEAAGELPVTFHRAFDTLTDPDREIETLIRLGVWRILASATDLPRLASAVRAAAGRIEIMAGGGVHPGLVDAILRTGVDAIHASAKRTVSDPVGIALGSSAPAGEHGRETTDERQAAQIMAAMRPRPTRAAADRPAGTGRPA